MNQTDHLVLIGKVTAPHGIKGEMKLSSYTSFPTDFFKYEPFFKEDGSSFSLSHYKLFKNNIFIISSTEVSSRNDAEILCPFDIYTNKSNLPAPENDEYYHNDLQNCKIIINNQIVGIVQSVQNYGAGTFLEINCIDGKYATIPFSKDAILEENIPQKTLIVHEDFLLK